MIYTITMNPAIDCSVSAPALSLGKVNRTESQTIRFGGKGINVSYVLSEFGGESVLTGFVAGFTGNALESGLTDEGFTCDFVKLSEGDTRINVKLTGGTKNGDPDTEINAPGPSPTANDLNRLTEKLTHLTDGDVVVLAGSLPHGVSADYIKILASSFPAGVRFICDLSGESLRTALACSPYFVKPNIHELYELMGIDATAENLCDHRLVESCAEKLMYMGAKNALITMGEDGGFYITDDGESGFVAPPEFRCVESTLRSAVGCGDSAVAGWIIGMGFAGESVRTSALAAAGIASDSSPAHAAAKLVITLGSTSFFCSFPPSPEKLQLIINT